MTDGAAAHTASESQRTGLPERIYRSSEHRMDPLASPTEADSPRPVLDTHDRLGRLPGRNDHPQMMPLQKTRLGPQAFAASSAS